MSDLNIEVAGGTSVRLLTGGKYCDKNIVVTALGSLTGYRYIRFIINALRGNTKITQLSELEFIDSSGKVFAYPSGATVTATIANEYPEEEPDKVIDGSTDTKFCCTSYMSGMYLQIDLGTSGRIDPSVYSRFRWYTANDSPERDPVSFEVRFSNDGINFDTGISVTGATITTERKTLAYTGNCIEGGGSGSSRLPSGYTELEYLEGSGTQYIDTGFVPNQDTRAVLDLEYEGSTISTSGYICGARTSSAANQFALQTNSSNFSARYGTQNETVVSGTISGRYTIDMNKTVFTVNGTSITLTNETFTCPDSFHIFALNNNGTGGYSPATGMKLYSCQIYDNGTLVRDFVPCINASGAYGLYDLINAEFYGNAGTGAFTGVVKPGSGSTEQATPVISVDSNGLIIATAGTKSATKQLTTQGAKTVTPGTSNQTVVSSGVYVTGAVTVKGDSNLVAANIKKGVSIFGVSGSLEDATAMTVAQIRAICT